MDTRIRDYGPLDEQPVVELSLRAWAPVFSSLAQGLGREIFVRLHGDWRQYQEQDVRDTLADDATKVWVAEAARGVVGFVAAKLHPERQIGEIWMLAVDPHAQGRGIGTALTEVATGWLREAGMTVAWSRRAVTRVMLPHGASTRRWITRCFPWPDTSRPCDPRAHGATATPTTAPL